MTKEEYAEKLKDPRWQRKRREILRRDGHQCRWCGSTDWPLEIHHLQYVFGRDPWDYEDDNFRTLCGWCHKKEKLRRHMIPICDENGEPLDPVAPWRMGSTHPLRDCISEYLVTLGVNL